MPLALPTGTRCLIDANIFYYHFVETTPSDPCSDLLQRVLDGEIVGVTSTHLLSEAIHKIMLAEAAQRLAVPRAGLVSWLQRQPQRIMDLSAFRQNSIAFAQMNLKILTVGLDALEEAAALCQSVGLLMNDATTVALMRKEAIVDLATNDDDFDGVPGLRIWKPR